MNSKTGFLTFILFLLIFSACQKEPDPKPLPEAGYPTTYKPLSQVEWNERNTEFQKINIHEGLSLNEYGFMEGEISISEVDSLTEEFVVDKLDSIVNRYKSFLGITVNINIENDIKINVPYLGLDLGPGTINYYFEGFKYYQQQDYWPELKEKFTIQRYFITQTKINDKIFLGPTIYFIFNETNKTIQISGKWLPNVYIPHNEIYTLDDIIPIACIVYKEKTGIDFWEKKQEFAIVKLMIHIQTESGIEIRECWRINTLINNNYTYGDLFIDTQTGEIIRYNERKIHI